MARAGTVVGVGGVALAVVVYANMTGPGPGDARWPQTGEHHPRPEATGPPPEGYRVIRFYAGSEKANAYSVGYTIAGADGGLLHPKSAGRLDWQRDMAVKPGEPLVIRVVPVDHPRGRHWCGFEDPPGQRTVTLPGARDQQYGTTAAVCTYIPS
jgi:hypothetical protein